MIFERRIGLVILKLLLYASLSFTIVAATSEVNPINATDIDTETSSPITEESYNAMDIDAETSSPINKKTLSYIKYIKTVPSEINIDAMHKALPRHYNITLTILKTYHGKSSIILEVVTKTKFISFHVSNLQIETIRLTGYNVQEEYIPYEYFYVEEKEMITLKFRNEILPELYILTMSFRCTLAMPENFIMMKYRDKGSTQESYLSPLVPGNPRHMFPCWDHPEFEATFNITIEHSTECTALSSMESTNRLTTDTTISTSFRTTPLTSTHFVAIALVNLVIWTDDYDTTYMWCRWQISQQTIAAHNIIEKLNMFFFWYFNNTEIIRVKNIVVLPNFPFPAMGRWSFLVLREEDIVYDESSHFPGRKIAVIKTLTTNIAYQWLNSYSKQTSWSPTVLNEAFASYIALESIEQLSDIQQGVKDLFAVQVLQTAFQIDRKSIIGSSADDFDPFYTSSVVKKAFIMIRMLDHMITSAKLQESILEFHRMRYATIEDFIKIVHKKYEQVKVETFMDNKIEDIIKCYLSQMKYPILFINRKYNTGEVEVKQDIPATWTVPITYITQSNFFFDTTPKIYLFPGNISFYGIHGINPHDWLIVNIQQTGYYRVNYDIKNWLMIAQYLNFEDYKKIHVINRAQIIDDAFYFVMKNKIEYSAFLDIISYLSRETDYIPWYSMINILWYISPYLEYPQSGFIKIHILDILDRLLKNVGYNDTPLDNDMQKALRLLATRWACKLGHSECRKMANAKLIKHLSNPYEYPISPWWQDWTYCAGLMNADDNTWHRLVTMFIVQNNIENFKYLSCAEDDSIIIEYLTSNSSNNLRALVRGEQYSKLFVSILKKHARKEKILEAIFANFHKVKPSVLMINLPLKFYSGLSTIETFIHIIMGLYSKQSLDKIDSNMLRYMFAITQVSDIDNEYKQLEITSKTWIELRLARIASEKAPFEKWM